VDILLTHPDEEVAQDLLGLLLASLQGTSFVSAVLSNHCDTSGKEQEHNYEGRWSHASMCIVRLPEDEAPLGVQRPLRHRRMDLKVRCAAFAWMARTADACLLPHAPGVFRCVNAVRAAVLYRQRPL
jgi:hypothetical protein